jgi:hypothetical protein
MAAAEKSNTGQDVCLQIPARVELCKSKRAPLGQIATRNERPEFSRAHVSTCGPARLSRGADSGSHRDSGALSDGFGLILEYPQAKITAFAGEHGFLDLSRSNARPKVGRWCG